MDDTIQRVLGLETWAVVGCSPDPWRDSHRIAALLIDRGYDVIPVNPGIDEVLGRECFPSVHAIGRPVDVVDIFRRADQAGRHVDEAIEVGAGGVWMQLGVVDEQAAARARAAGLEVVMDRCPAIELSRLGIAGPEDGGWRAQLLEVKRPPDDVPRTYSRLAPVYELWARLTEAKPRRRVLELAAPRPGEDVLEVAVGTGVQLVELARRSPSGRTVGIEPAAGMLAQARRRLRSAGLGDVELMEGSALALPFADASFDLLVNGYMLDLLPRDDIPRALAEFRRVLRPGGRLVLSNMTKGERASHRVWDWLYARGIVLTANCRGVLAAPVLRELGFTDVRREYLAQMSFPTEIVTARKAADGASDAA